MNQPTPIPPDEINKPTWKVEGETPDTLTLSMRVTIPKVPIKDSPKCKQHFYMPWSNPLPFGVTLNGRIPFFTMNLSSK